MINTPGKFLHLVVSAIKNLQERKGSSCRAIVNYISSLCDIPRDIAQRQVLTALKRGTTHGILRETDGHYCLPTSGSSECLEIATQELGLLDLTCRKRKQEARKRKSMKGSCGSAMRRKKSRSRKRRSSRSKSRGCAGSRGRSRKKSRGRSRKRSRGRGRKRSKNRARKSRSKYNCATMKSRSKKKKRKSKKDKNCACPPKPAAQNDHKCALNFPE
ncbi:serine/arginine-rich splicing factor 6 [Fopius arisanus]|uniref:H1E protein n=1 Tax=Fopius arisanus TaxID=64838 RepID=A0A0C9QLG4_9HYME|nr:PREDICTED: serine/arginine-rich splicing factor 6-like [Fopius arisanus]